MPPDSGQLQQMQFGGGVAVSMVNPAVLLVVLLAGVVICIGSRKIAIATFLTVSLLIPIDQILLLGPFHFPMMRLVALFGLIRILWAKFSTKEEIFSGGMNGIDKAVILLTVFTAADGILLWRGSGEVILQLGNRLHRIRSLLLVAIPDSRRRGYEERTSRAGVRGGRGRRADDL